MTENNEKLELLEKLGYKMLCPKCEMRGEKVKMDSFSVSHKKCPDCGYVFSLSEKT